MLDVGIERKVVQKAGSYFSFGDERLGQGRQNATNFLIEHPDLVQQILARIQAEVPAEQIVSARLLPQADGAGEIEVTPIEDEVAVEDEVASRRSALSSSRRGTRRHGRPTHAMAVPVVTALRARGPGRVAVELDGAPWRVVPLEAVYGAGLVVGGTLDRPTARDARPRAAAARRAGRGAAGAAGARPHGCVARAAARRDEARPRPSGETRSRRRNGPASSTTGASRCERAEQLAARGSGDLLIGDDLERQGVPPELVQLAIAALEPEADRAGTIVEARGSSPKTARYLASRGFSEAALESIIANLAADTIG